MKHFIVDIALLDSGHGKPELLHRHARFLEEGYNANIFLVCGQNSAGDGQQLLARAESRAALVHFLGQDPLWVSGDLEIGLTEFVPQLYPALLKGWFEPMGRPSPELLLGTMTR